MIKGFKPRRRRIIIKRINKIYEDIRNQFLKEFFISTCPVEELEKLSILIGGNKIDPSSYAKGGNVLISKTGQEND